MNFYENLVIHDDNLNVMQRILDQGVSIDLMLWDPPYNTGLKSMVYDDRNPDYIGFMRARLELAHKLLKPTGSIAIHIGHHALFKLGTLMDSIFGEKNRISTITWECSTAPKNQARGISNTADYVLIYAKDKARTYYGKIPRTEKMDAAYKYTDGNRQFYKGSFFITDHQKYSVEGFSTQSSNSLTSNRFFGIENPFTTAISYPPLGRVWRKSKESCIEILNQWGVNYIEVNNELVVAPDQDRTTCKEILKNGPWPKIFFGKDGLTRPVQKVYLDEVIQNRVLGTYWRSEEFEPISEALRHDVTGDNGLATKEVIAILGDGNLFDFPKFKREIMTDNCVRSFYFM